MNWETLILDFLKAAVLRPLVLVAAATCVVHLLRVRHPASKHAIWTATLLGIFLTPVISVFIPHVNLTVPAWFKIETHRQSQSQSIHLEPVVRTSTTSLPSTMGVQPGSPFI